MRTLSNRLGKCKHCGGPAFDAAKPPQNWTGFRGTFMLMDGTSMDLTICSDCGGGELDLDKIWQNVLRGWEAERQLAVQRRRPQDEAPRRKFLRKQAGENRVLAVLGLCPWPEALADDPPLMMGW